MPLDLQDSESLQTRSGGVWGQRGWGVSTQPQGPPEASLWTQSCAGTPLTTRFLTGHGQHAHSSCGGTLFHCTHQPRRPTVRGLQPHRCLPAGAPDKLTGGWAAVGGWDREGQDRSGVGRGTEQVWDLGAGRRGMQNLRGFWVLQAGLGSRGTLLSPRKGTGEGSCGGRREQTGDE